MNDPWGVQFAIRKSHHGHKQSICSFLSTLILTYSKLPNKVLKMNLYLFSKCEAIDPADNLSPTILGQWTFLGAWLRTELLGKYVVISGLAAGCTFLDNFWENVCTCVFWLTSCIKHYTMALSKYPTLQLKKVKGKPQNYILI